MVFIHNIVIFHLKGICEIIHIGCIIGLALDILWTIYKKIWLKNKVEKIKKEYEKQKTFNFSN